MTDAPLFVPLPFYFAPLPFYFAKSPPSLSSCLPGSVANFVTLGAKHAYESYDSVHAAWVVNRLVVLLLDSKTAITKDDVIDFACTYRYIDVPQALILDEVGPTCKNPLILAERHSRKPLTDEAQHGCLLRAALRVVMSEYAYCAPDDGFADEEVLLSALSYKDAIATLLATDKRVKYVADLSHIVVEQLIAAGLAKRVKITIDFSALQDCVLTTD